MREICKILLMGAAIVLVSCSGGGKKTESISFPMPEIPSVVTGQTDKQIYSARCFWSKYFANAQMVDSLELEKGMSYYAKLLKNIPLDEGCAAVGKFAEQLESCEDSLLYDRLAALFEKYLFDPNSPFRDEDLYGAFATARAESAFTPEDMREAYRSDAALCSLNRRGTKAADVRYRTVAGRNGTLYSVNAKYTLLLFSNPGCENCKEIQASLDGNQVIKDLIDGGKLAILNVYVDEDLDAWREYVPNYPERWINGYDPYGIIRSDQTYNLRAIPSLYVLDADKTVMLKDAPLPDVMKFLLRL